MTPAESDGASPHQADSVTAGRGSTVDTLNAGSNSAFTPAPSDMYSVPTTATSSSTANDQSFSWMPNDISWANLQPIYATGDLVYNDLVGIRDDNLVPQWVASQPGMMDDPDGQPWQFDGDFGNDSVWSLLNQYTPF